MAKGYVILTEAIKDPEVMKAYAQAAGAAMGGVNVLAVDTAPKAVEGSWHGDHEPARAHRRDGSPTG